MRLLLFINGIILYIKNSKEFTHTQTIATNKQVQQNFRTQDQNAKINCISIHK